MKSIIISSAALVLCFTFVSLSAAYTGRILDDLIESINHAATPDDYEDIIKEFRRADRFLMLTLHDSTLFEIEYSILEVKDFLEYGSEDEATAAKSRLISKIREPRRLSGFNMNSVF